MVTNQASIKRDGVQDFVSLRTTAVVILAYSLFILWFFITTPVITWDNWANSETGGLFSLLPVKVFTLAALVSVMIHVRIGLWQVLTDYVKSHRLRVIIQYVLNLIAFAYVAVGIFVLWGIK